MKVLIIEPIASGHRIALYVRYVIPKLLKENCIVTLLTTQQAKSHPSFRLLREFIDKIELLDLPNLPMYNGNASIGILKNQIESWWLLKKTIKEISTDKSFDIVYIPTVDWVIKAIEILGSPFGKIPFVILFLSPKHHRHSVGLGAKSRNDLLYKFLFWRLLKIHTLHYVLVINEFFYSYCKNVYGSISKKVKYIPDFGEIRGVKAKDDCRNELGITNTEKVLLVYGSMTKRKGIFQLFKTLIENPTIPGLKIIVAGNPDSEVLSFFTRPEISQMVADNQIILRLFFHDEQDEFTVFRASDFGWLGYENGFSSSSGVLFQFMYLGIPVISQQGGIIGDTVNKYRLGITINPEDSDSILSGLKACLDWDRKKELNHEGIQKFAQRHSSTIHAQIVYDSLNLAF